VISIWNILSENFATFTKAAGITLELTAVSLFIATFIGLFFAFLKVSKTRVLNMIADGYIGLIRGLPLIVQLMFLYFGISSLITLPRFWAGSLALAIHAGAYVAEIFRGAIQSIDRGQVEAARSLGMKESLAMRRVILPQAALRAIPPLGNQFIIGLKDSSLVAYLGVLELYGFALLVQAENFEPFQTYFVAGLYYLVMVIIFTLIVKKLERRLAVSTRPGSSGAKPKRPRASRQGVAT
jgi:polar amino acid transport system permease protein